MEIHFSSGKQSFSRVKIRLYVILVFWRVKSDIFWFMGDGEKAHPVALKGNFLKEKGFKPLRYTVKKYKMGSKCSFQGVCVFLRREGTYSFWNVKVFCWPIYGLLRNHYISQPNLFTEKFDFFHA